MSKPTVCVLSPFLAIFSSLLNPVKTPGPSRYHHGLNFFLCTSMMPLYYEHNVQNLQMLHTVAYACRSQIAHKLWRQLMHIAWNQWRQLLRFKFHHYLQRKRNFWFIYLHMIWLVVICQIIYIMLHIHGMYFS